MTLCKCNTVDVHGVGKFINQVHPDQVLDIVGLMSVTKDVQRHCYYLWTKFIVPEICNSVSGTT
jgi:hypothetical protein